MFTQSCFIRKNTPELRKKLEDLGYYKSDFGSDFNNSIATTVFNEVLVRQYDVSAWCADFYSYYDEVGGYAVCTGDVHYDYCIPYNEDTKHLVGKSKDAPVFYRYWEDK